MGNKVLNHVRVISLLCLLSLSAPPAHAAFDQLIREGVAAYNMGQFKEAQRTFTDLMNKGAKEYGAMDPRMGRIYSNLGEAYSADGNYYYASAYLKRALAVKEKSFGANSFELVPTLNGLGKIADGSGKFAEAETYYRRALGMAEKAGTKGDAYVGIIECNLGALYYHLGKPANAIPHFKKGLPIAEQLYGAEHDFLLNSVKMYSNSLKAAGDATQAKQVEELAVAKAREAISPLAQWKKNFSGAETASQAGKTDEAERLYRAAIPWAEHIPDQMPLVITLNRCANICLQKNKNVEALEFLKRAQPLSEKQLGTDDPQVIKHAEELAALAVTQGRYDLAEPYYLQVLVYNKKQFGPASGPMRDTLSKLGILYNSSGDYAKATKVLTRAVSIDEKAYGASDVRLLPVLTSLADSYKGDLKFAESEATYKRAVSILEKQPNCDASLADLLEQFSKLPQQLSQWDKAEVLLKRAVALREKSPGKDNVALLASLQVYANMLRSASQRDRAEPIEQRIAAMKARAASAPTASTSPSVSTAPTAVKRMTDLDKALE